MSESLPIVVANLKANLKLEDILSWLLQVGPAAQEFKGTVIFCPGAPYLITSQAEIQKNQYKIKLGAQDISKFEEGAHTGEIAASQLTKIVSYALVGHSERRDDFKETDRDLLLKIENAKRSDIEPILCLQDENTEIFEGVQIVAYEPKTAIGTNKPEPPEDAKRVLNAIKNKVNSAVLYGGSVSADNAKSFLDVNFNGLLVGATNSLNPQSFIAILKSL